MLATASGGIKKDTVTLQWTAEGPNQTYRNTKRMNELKVTHRLDQFLSGLSHFLYKQNVFHQNHLKDTMIT